LSRYHINTDVRRPNGDLAGGVPLYVYTDSTAAVLG